MGIEKRIKAPERANNLIFVGLQMKKAITSERCSHYIGEKIVIKRKIDNKEKEKTVDGCVIGIYPHFLLLDCGNYNTTISYKDLVLGGKI